MTSTPKHLQTLIGPLPSGWNVNIVQLRKARNAFLESAKPTLPPQRFHQLQARKHATEVKMQAYLRVLGVGANRYI